MPISGKRVLIIIVFGLITITGLIYFFFISNLPLSKSQRKTLEEIGEEKTFNPILLSWQEATTTPPWSPRDSHEVVVFKDKLWLMGGLNGNGFVERPGVVKYGKAPHFSDIWVSDDGINWNLVTDKAPWGKRRSIQAVVFQDKIWLIPGWGPWAGTKNDIWNSEDGINWNLITPNPNFPPREGHQLVVFQDKLWLFGGVNYDKGEIKNDVWYSDDGINWLEATLNAPWSARWDHEVCVFQDKLWLIGGMDLNGNVFGDIWVSENGKDWILISDNPPWPKRQGHGVVVYKDKIWIVGRFNEESQGNGKNDVWFSEDGITWQETNKNPPWEGREDFPVVVFKDKIWIFGGMTIDWVWKNDTWYSK